MFDDISTPLKQLWIVWAMWAAAQALWYSHARMIARAKVPVVLTPAERPVVKLRPLDPARSRRITAPAPASVPAASPQSPADVAAP